MKVYYPKSKNYLFSIDFVQIFISFFLSNSSFMPVLTTKRKIEKARKRKTKGVKRLRKELKNKWRADLKSRG